MPTSEELIGKRFGRLVVIAVAENYNVVCKCDCGKLKEISKYSLLKSPIESEKNCGCLKSEETRLRFTTHGQTANKKTSLEYQSWCAMIARCTNPKDKRWSSYGGRGIIICERWRNSFADFLADMGERPTTKHTLDRIEVDGNYEPGNVKWASPEEQANNKRCTRKITYKGDTLSIAQWSERLDIKYMTLVQRLNKGMSPEEAFEKPIGKRADEVLITYQGKTLNLRQWVETIGIKGSVISGRLKRGWTIEQAVTTPLKKRNRKRLESGKFGTESWE